MIARRHLDALLAAGIIAVAAGAAGLVGANDWIARRPTRGPRPPERVDDWRTYATRGHRAGPADAPVIITVFSDFQCPFCRRSFGALRTLLAKHRGDVAVIYRQFPLKSTHAYAYAAALASECASAQGHFAAYQRSLFDHPAQLSQEAWTSVAHHVGIVDTAAFSRCMRDSTYASVVGADLEAGRKLGVRSTPTVLVNSWRLHEAATAEALEAVVANELKGSKPSR